jgi:hypothetical protein
MTTAVLERYAPPTVLAERGPVVETNDAPVFVAAAGWVALVFGSAFLWCRAVCGWNNVKSCSTSWLQVKATCKK